MKLFAGRALRLGMLRQPAILALAVHQYKAGGIPELVAKVSVTLAALAVEVDAAAQACQRCKGKAQGICTVTRNASRKFFFSVFSYLWRRFRLAQALRAFVQQRCQFNPVNQVNRIQHIAFRLAHLFALRVFDQAMDVHVFERNLPREMRGHHDHAGDPKENDVVASHQHARGQKQIEFFGFFRPTHC